MSVYKPNRSPYYQYDFELGGHRFHGSTKATTRREAEKFEAAERERRKAELKAAAVSSKSLAIDHVADRFFEAEGQYYAEPQAVETNLARLVEYFGPGTLLTDIDDEAVRKLVAWRRGQRVKRRGVTKPDAALVSPATVNRSTTKVLARLFGFAKGERAIFAREPDWSQHWLKEPVERVRELQDHEADSIDASMRDDYEPFFAFARATGLRYAECLTLRWTEVNFGSRQIVRLGKGGRRVTFPITDTIREILFPLQGHDRAYVFTYVCKQTKRVKLKGGAIEERIRGQRYPLTKTGAKAAWQAIRAKAGVTDFRFHDYRHDLGSKLLRETGNLKLVQRTLNHKDIKSTLRYAHVLDADIAEGVEAVAKSRTRSARDAKSRTISRTAVRKVS